MHAKEELPMLSKNKIKFIRSLGQKKQRLEEGMFVAEGPKVVGDLLDEGASAELIVATESWIVRQHQPACKELLVCSDEELRRASFLQHPQEVIAVFPISAQVSSSAAKIDDEGLYVALDGIQDPGNLGTIIRIADWYGINTIFCSTDTADGYNPKVIQATMGSIARVKLIYTELQQLIENLPEDYPIYGTLLDGEDIYQQQLTRHGLIVMGNEGNGISLEIRKLITHKLFIPSHSTNKSHAESLNVAIATAITCAEFRRRK